MIQQFLITQKDPANADLVGNSISNNQFGLNGTDLNGRDLTYDGNGSGNCISGNSGVQTTVPADQSTFATACPFAGANAFSGKVQEELISWAVDGTHEKFLVQHDHAAKAGLVPLFHYSDYTGTKAPLPAARP